MEFYRSQLGKTLSVLWEHEDRDGMMFGFTENYVRVKKAYDPTSANQIEMLKLEHIDDDGHVAVVPAFDVFLSKV